MLTVMLALLILPADEKLPERYLPAVKEVLQAAIATGDFKAPLDFTGPYELHIGATEAGADTILFSWINHGVSKYIRKVGARDLERLDLDRSHGGYTIEFPHEYWFRVKPVGTGAVQTLDLEFPGKGISPVELYYPNRDRADKYQYQPAAKPAAKKRHKASRRGKHAAAFFFSRSIKKRSIQILDRPCPVMLLRRKKHRIEHGAPTLSVSAHNQVGAYYYFFRGIEGINLSALNFVFTTKAIHQWTQTISESVYASL